MNTKRSGWITGIVVLQLPYALMLLALAIYLISETLDSPNAQPSIVGLEIAAAVVRWSCARCPRWKHRFMEREAVGMVADSRNRPGAGCCVVV
jgi:hypothetical protein